jgi:hypothetical protein
MHMFANLCVFCGANRGNHPAYIQAAHALGRTLAQRSIGLIYGGGTVGMMGELARAAADEGGRLVGVIPEALMDRERINHAPGELIVVQTMQERKAKMASLADGFIAMPGGFGTLDELFEVITWAQLGIHNKPIGLLNVLGFFDPLLQWTAKSVAADFIRPPYDRMFQVADTPERLLEQLAMHETPPGQVRWGDLQSIG